MIDEFIYQFSMACKLRAQESNGDRLRQFHDKNEIFWNLETVKTTLTTLIADSKILTKDGKSFQKLDDLQTNHIFGYYSIIGLLRIYVQTNDFESALKILEPIDFNSLLVYSKSIPCYINLFHYAGYTYLMSKSMPFFSFSRVQGGSQTL
jgi:translation initiation factor 3 subunit L